MVIYTIGFTKKSAEEFFGIISKTGTSLLIDTRLNNNSQISGFAKGRDLPFFLKRLCGCGYVHELRLAPTKEMLSAYRKKIIPWNEYEKDYRMLYDTRGMAGMFQEIAGGRKSVILLCSEAEPAYCHRRLLAEMLAADIPGIAVKHV